jgi:hypothetical protein
LYGQSRFRESPLRQGRHQTEFLDSAKPQRHPRQAPAGSPDKDTQDNDEHDNEEQDE